MIMLRSNIWRTYIWWLYLNIGFSAICILIIIGLAYQKNKYSYPVNTDKIIQKQETSTSTTEYENISNDLPNQIEDIHAFVNVIRQQSKDQLRAWQQKNADPTFTPEIIIPTFFKKFNGDITSMKR